MKKIRNKLIAAITIFSFLLVGCDTANTPTGSTIKGADIVIKTSEKKNVAEYGEVYYLNVRNSQGIFKFADYVETNENATWTVSTDVQGKDIIPTRTVELEFGNPSSNLYYIYVSNEAAKMYETYPVLIHRNFMFTVSFDSDGGTSCEPQNVEEGYCLDSSKIPIPEKTGYTFLRWDYDFSLPVTHSFTVNAVWQAKHYTITFDPNGGTVSPSTIEVEYGAYGSIADGSLPTPVKYGYDFLGWSYEGTVFTSNYYYFDKDITLVAQWSPTEYAITYVLNGGRNSSFNPTKYNVEETIHLFPASKDLNSFMGWKDENNQYVTTIENPKQGGITLTASWSSRNYCYGFELENNSGYTLISCDLQQSVNDGETISLFIDDYYNGLPIIGIGTSALSNLSFVDTVILPKTINGIGERAFENQTALSRVVIPVLNRTYGGITLLGALGEGIFSNCPNLFCLEYEGTKDQWNSLTKNNTFKNSSVNKIHCSDGDISI